MNRLTDMLNTKPMKYRGYKIRFSRGNWFVDDETGAVAVCVWSKKDGKRWVDNEIKTTVRRTV